jgi:short-subunit dehydrogenase
MDYRDRVVVVTGASSGIGRVTAREFARRGAVVVAIARREDLLRGLVDECQIDSPATEYLAGDLGERGFAEHAIAETVAHHGRLHVLVNNAGMPLHKRIYHTSADEAERVMDVNFMSCVWCTFAALPHMLREGGGSIVNVSSFAGVVAPPRETLYAASKRAMDGFTQGLWTELEGSNIHVGLLTLGAIDTEIWEKQAETNVYTGTRLPAQVVADGIFEMIERRTKHLTLPKRNAGLVAARLLHQFLPSLLRLGLRRMDPVAEEVVERARERARAGLPHGQLREGEVADPEQD